MRRRITKRAVSRDLAATLKAIRVTHRNHVQMMNAERRMGKMPRTYTAPKPFKAK